MGSGGMIVMDETSCMVDVAKYFMEFCMTRILRQVHSLPRRHRSRCTASWRRSRAGEATAADLALLEELCDLVRQHQPVRPGPERAESRCVTTLQILPRRVPTPTSTATGAPRDVCRGRLQGKHKEAAA